jgi:hypothetical protein
MKSLSTKALWLSLIFVAGAAGARGQILTDTFSEVAPLDGQSPTTSASPTPEYWTADSNITTNGSEAVLPDLYASDNEYAAATGYVGIPSNYLTSSDLTVGTTYSLTFTLGVSAVSSKKGGVGYAGFGTLSQTGHVPYQNGNEGSFYAFDNGGQFYVAVSDSANNFSLTELASNTGTDPVTITLNITAAAGDNDLLTATIGGNQVFSETATIFPTADVFVSDLTADATVSDLSLSAPEPSTYALLLVGGLALAGVCARGRQAILA